MLWQRMWAWFSRLHRVLSLCPAAADRERQMGDLTWELRACKQEVRTELTALKSAHGCLKEDMKDIKSALKVLLQGQESLLRGQETLLQGMQGLMAAARVHILEEKVRYTMTRLVRTWMPDEMRSRTGSTILAGDSPRVGNWYFLRTYCVQDGLLDSLSDPTLSAFVQVVWTQNSRRQRMRFLVVGEVAEAVGHDDADETWSRATWLRDHVKAPFCNLSVVPLVVGMRDLHTVADYADGRLPLLQVATDYKPLSMTMQTHHLAPWPDAGTWHRAMTHWQVGRWAPN